MGLHVLITKYLQFSFFELMWQHSKVSAGGSLKYSVSKLCYKYLMLPRNAGQAAGQTIGSLDLTVPNRGTFSDILEGLLTQNTTC